MFGKEQAITEFYFILFFCIRMFTVKVLGGFSRVKIVSRGVLTCKCL